MPEKMFVITLQVAGQNVHTMAREQNIDLILMELLAQNKKRIHPFAPNLKTLKDVELYQSTVKTNWAVRVEPISVPLLYAGEVLRLTTPDSLTDEQCAKYEDHDCPFCGEDDLIDRGDYEYDADVWRKDTCQKCGKSWLETWAFAGKEDAP
jgi:hypothetical protein